MVLDLKRLPYPTAVAVVLVGLLTAIACSSSPDNAASEDAMVIEPSDEARASEGPLPAELDPQATERRDDVSADVEDSTDATTADDASTTTTDEVPPPSSDDAPPPRAHDAPPPSAHPRPPATDEAPPPSSANPDEGQGRVAAAGGTDLPSSPDEVTQAQIEEFASVYIDVMELQLAYEPQIKGADDPTEAEQMYHNMERKALETVESYELTLDEFHAIAHLLENDDDLRNRIQAEVDQQALEE